MARTKEQLLIEREHVLKNIEKRKIRITEIDEEIKALENKKWKPELDELFYLINVDGNVGFTRLNKFHTKNAILQIGNYFKNIEEAEFAVERLKVLEELKEFSYEFSDEEWEYGDFDKFILYYNYETNEIDIDCLWNCKYDSIHFKTKEDAQKAINKIGKERLKKYYFKVGNHE